MRLQSYLLSAQDILQQFDGTIPFAAWLKNYFKEHKKYGSRDRKLIADVCFCYFRLGTAFHNFSTEDRMLMAQFLCHRDSRFVTELKPEWVAKGGASLEEKISFLGSHEGPLFFPFPEEVSQEIEKETFNFSFLQQPDLFLRIRPGKEEMVTSKLNEASVLFTKQGACLQLSNSTKADAVLQIDEEAVIQDLSSQRVLEPLQQHLKRVDFSAWDCCAASGGKTILLHDTYPKARLTVSDIRESILINLKARLKKAGITSYRSFVADISAAQSLPAKKFTVILCDAPCSGSGTWGRTPEQLVFFRKEKIDDYAALQKRIAANASRCLEEGGFFLYITCSVFKKENEDVVTYLQENTALRLLQQQYFTGYDKRGDTLFAALFTT